MFFVFLFVIDIATAIVTVFANVIKQSTTVTRPLASWISVSLYLMHLSQSNHPVIA